MRKGKPGIPKRPSSKTRELRIPIKQKTAENIATLNTMVEQKRGELQKAMADLSNHILPLVTEGKVPEGAQVEQVTDKPPYELVVRVPA